jgi:hypothetical protein
MDVMFGVPAGWRRVVICDSPAQGLRTRCAATSAWASSAAAASPAGPAHPEEVAPYRRYWLRSEPRITRCRLHRPRRWTWSLTNATQRSRV